jgi:hypothetical protein
MRRTMRFLSPGLAAWCAGLALACAFASLVRSAEPAQPDGQRLQPLEFLLGHCWRGSFPDGKSVDTHCFEGVYGQFVRDLHIVQRDGPDYCGESVYWWDPQAQAVTYRYFNSDGGTSTGTMTAAGRRLQFANEVYTAPDGSKQTYRTSWARGENGYVAVTEQQQQDGWKEAWRIEFTRLEPDVGSTAKERAVACQRTAR